MAIQSLRQFLKALEEYEELVNVKQEVDWDCEAGAIARKIAELRGPAILFEKVKGYPDGYRICYGSVGTYKRLAIAMGMDPESTLDKILSVYEAKTEHTVKPKIVSDGPCKEHIITGDDVDIYRLPCPMVHEGDGGRYLGTWDIVICKDPETEWTNWGMYRFMVHNSKYMVGEPSPVSHFAKILKEKYIPKGQSMPVALVLGASPICHLVSATPYRAGEDEVDFAGALLGEPVKLVKCQTNDLLVPANAEVIVEGEILPDVTLPEAPFGEYTGYRVTGQKGGVVMRISAITHRKDPIITTVSIGMPLDDNGVALAISMALEMKRRLKQHGIPVLDVYLPPEGGSQLCLVRLKTGTREVVRQVSDILAGRRSYLTNIWLFNEDVNIFDLNQVIHAFATRCDPSRDVSIIEGEGRGAYLNPGFSKEERLRLKLAVSIADCTWREEWQRGVDIPVANSFNEIFSQELQDKVMKNLTSYGFKMG
jgi:4-hydroxy-3-polyprenylbenzoate decarboxylase